MKRFLLCFLLLFLLFPSASRAEGIVDGMIPHETEKSQGKVELDYNKYPLDHYQMDTYIDTTGNWLPWNWGEAVGQNVYVALMEITNMVWLFNMMISRFVIFWLGEAFGLDLISNVIDTIGDAIQQLTGFDGGFRSHGLWVGLLSLMIVLAGTWALWTGAIKRETNRAMSGLISSIIVITLALGFFSQAAPILRGINSFSSDVQSEVLSVSASIVDPNASYTKEEGIATIKNQMWSLLVYKPYLLLQYGNTVPSEIQKTNSERIDNILALSPLEGGKANGKRQEVVKQEVEGYNNSMMSVSGVKGRAAALILITVANSILSLFLVAVTGSMLLYQVFFLALVLFSPVALLLAIVPSWQGTAVAFAMKVLHAQLMKVGIGLLLTILFTISSLLYRATNSTDYGYLTTILLQIVSYVGVWWKRKDLFELVTSVASNAGNSMVAQNIRNYQNKVKQAAVATGIVKHMNGSGKPENRQTVTKFIGLAQRGQKRKTAPQAQKQAVGSTSSLPSRSARKQGNKTVLFDRFKKK